MRSRPRQPASRRQRRRTDAPGVGHCASAVRARAAARLARLADHEERPSGEKREEREEVAELHRELEGEANLTDGPAVTGGQEAVSSQHQPPGSATELPRPECALVGLGDDGNGAAGRQLQPGERLGRDSPSPAPIPS